MMPTRPLPASEPMGRALSHPGLRGSLAALHLHWGIIGAILGLYILVTLRALALVGHLGNGWALANAFLTPANHVAAVVVLVPLVWRLRNRAGRLLPFAVRLLLALAASEGAAALIVLVDAWFQSRTGVPYRSPAAVLRAYVAVVGPAMMVVGGLIAARARAVEENDAIRQEAVIAKTRLLQSQLHPHVLFNALNGLAELIHRDPPLAEQSVRHLADLLRRTLSASEAPTFSLGEERALVQDYLFLEGLRLGPRLAVQWDWDASLDGVRVPPLLLQPLVENAIKHGITPQVDGGRLTVRSLRQGAGLRLEVWNSGAPYRPGPGGGIGLRNLEARLGLLFGAGAAFAIGPSEDGTLAAIQVAEMPL